MDFHKLVNTYDAFKYHWAVWKIVGIDPPRGRFRLLYLFYSVSINFFVTVLFPVTLIVNVFFLETVLSICENLTISITDVISNLKFLNVFVVRKKFRMVKEIVEKLDYRAGGIDEQKILKKAVRTAHRSFFTFLFLYSAAVITSQLVVVLSKERILMYPAWFPFDWKHSSSSFLYVNFYQLFGLIFQAIQDVANDTYPPAFLSILCGHIRALSLRLQALGNASMSPEENYQCLKNCIRDHQVILELCETIEDIISLSCFAQFVCSGLVQCTIGVYVLSIGMDISKITNMILFFSAVTLEIYYLCYYGHQLIHESEELAKAIYFCKWVDQSKEFKLAFIIFLQNSQRKNVIMAGKLFPVSLPTFLQVMKSAYSLFAVLNELK